MGALDAEHASIAAGGKRKCGGPPSSSSDEDTTQAFELLALAWPPQSALIWTLGREGGAHVLARARMHKLP